MTYYRGEYDFACHTLFLSIKSDALACKHTAFLSISVDVTLSPRKRDRICQQLNITKQSLANNLHKLAKVDAVRSVGRGEYQLNPELFAKGSWADIKNLQLSYRKRLKMTVEYDGDERTIRCDVVDREPVQLDIEDAIRHAAE